MATQNRLRDRGVEFGGQLRELASSEGPLDKQAAGWLIAAGHTVDPRRVTLVGDSPTPTGKDTLDAGDCILGVWDLMAHAAGEAWAGRARDPWQAGFNAASDFLWKLAAMERDLEGICRTYGKPSNPDQGCRWPSDLFLGYAGYSKEWLAGALPEGEARRTFGSVLAHPALLEAGRLACERYDARHQLAE